MVSAPGVSTRSRGSGSSSATVGAVAQDDRVLADGRQVHELVRLSTAHHAHVGRHRDHRQAAAAEDLEVRAVDPVVLLVQPGFVPVEGVPVFHRELAHPQQAATRARVVAELELDLVHEARQLSPGLHLAGRQRGHNLFVGQGQDVRPSPAIVEAGQLGPDGVVTAAPLPELGRVDERQQELGAADGVHLLPQHVLDSLLDTHSQRQEGEEALAELAHEGTAQKELVAGGLGAGRGGTQRRAEKLGHAHRQRLSVGQGAGDKRHLHCGHRPGRRTVARGGRMRPKTEGRVTTGAYASAFGSTVTDRERYRCFERL
jgi:hypothetical protein